MTMVREVHVYTVRSTLPGINNYFSELSKLSNRTTNRSMNIDPIMRIGAMFYSMEGQKEDFLILINDLLILINDLLILINDLLMLINDFLILINHLFLLINGMIY